MIKTLSELLESLKSAENEALKKQNIRHRPTIGDMYEGLTQSLLQRSLPPSAPWCVTSGFIVDAEGNLSEELDCLVVTGEGEEVPYTNKKKFFVDEVVAVIQVKKNLYGSDLRSGYQNLLSVNKFDPTRSIKAQLFQDAFQSITRRHLPPREEVDSLPFEVQMIYHALATCVARPVRIILGYNGFKSHRKFRQSFVDYLDEQIGENPKQGFGPTSLPDLIICGDYSLIKCNGMPYAGILDENGNWPFYCSASSNPLEFLLELIWTRLVYLHELSPSVFDEDVWLTPMHRFLSGKVGTDDKGRQGWALEVTPISEADLKKTPVLSLWELAFLDDTQFAVMNILCANGAVDLDEELSVFLTTNGYELEVFIKSLTSIGLAAREGDQLALLTRTCSCIILPDGRFAAGENVAGQLDRWLEIYLKERNEADAEK